MPYNRLNEMGKLLVIFRVCEGNESFPKDVTAIPMILMVARNIKFRQKEMSLAINLLTCFSASLSPMPS